MATPFPPAPSGTAAPEPALTVSRFALDALPAPLVAWLERHQPHPLFASPEWFVRLAEFEAGRGAAGRSWCWLVAWRGATPVLAAPLEQRRDRAGFLRLALLQNYYTPAIGLFADPARLAPQQAWACLLEALTLAYPRWLGLWAAPLAAPQAAALLQAAGGAGFALALSTNHGAAVPSLEAYWQARPSRLRNTLRRKHKLLAAQPHRFELARAPSAAQLAAYWRVYQASWKPQEPSHSFIDWLIGWGARRGVLRLGLLYIGAEPVACQLWLVHGGRAHIFKLAQDAAADRYSPGSLLTEYMIGQAVADDAIGHIDFLLGDDPYKRMWMDGGAPVSGVEVVNRRRAAGRLLGLFYRLRARRAVGYTARRHQPRPGAHDLSDHDHAS